MEIFLSRFLIITTHIDWASSAGWTKSNIDDAIYFFKASATDQYGGTYSSYVAGVSTGGANMNIIPSMQGFFVHVSNGAFPVTGSLGLTNSVRVTDLSHPFTKKKGIDNSIPLLRLSAAYSDDLTSADPSVIYFDEKAAEGFDGQLDALKLMNTDLKVPNLYAVTPEGIKLSINALPLLDDDSCKVPLGLKLNRTGNGTIIIKILEVDESLTGRRIYLSDIFAGTEQDLLPDKEFTVFLEKGEYLNRFFLNFSNETTGINDNIHTTDLFSIYSSNGILKAQINTISGDRGRLVVYNLTGQVLFIKEVYEKGYLEFKPGVLEGIYIITYTTGTNRSSKKVFIQNP
jgi:fibronectin-binding autotransporter adhesin